MRNVPRPDPEAVPLRPPERIVISASAKLSTRCLARLTENGTGLLIMPAGMCALRHADGPAARRHLFEDRAIRPDPGRAVPGASGVRLRPGQNHGADRTPAPRGGETRHLASAQPRHRVASRSEDGPLFGNSSVTSKMAGPIFGPCSSTMLAGWIGGKILTKPPATSFAAGVPESRIHYCADSSRMMRASAAL